MSVIDLSNVLIGLNVDNATELSEILSFLSERDATTGIIVLTGQKEVVRDESVIEEE